MPMGHVFIAFPDTGLNAHILVLLKVIFSFKTHDRPMLPYHIAY